jgi:NAD-dependent dihydropyrimidine dehydrogenase PreA subunit
MKRKIIRIDEKKCTGCGQCVPDCPEGALQVIEGKARLVSDLFCDGLGACIGTCPEGAITVIEREAGAYDEKAVMANVVPQGPAVITAHLEHLLGHGEQAVYKKAIEYLNEHHIPFPKHHIPGSHSDHDMPGHPSFASCPGSATRSIPRRYQTESRQQVGTTSSELRQWPVQLQLLNPSAGYFDHAGLLIAADCVPFAFADFHREFLKDKIVIIFCPKLDSDIDSYITKLSEIFFHHTINSITILHMEVPCCSGVTYIINQALERSGKNIPVKEFTITIDGQIM